jgi:hypothetical protein
LLVGHATSVAATHHSAALMLHSQLPLKASNRKGTTWTVALTPRDISMGLAGRTVELSTAAARKSRWTADFEHSIWRPSKGGLPGAFDLVQTTIARLTTCEKSLHWDCLRCTELWSRLNRRSRAAMSPDRWMVVRFPRISDCLPLVVTFGCFASSKVC